MKKCLFLLIIAGLLLVVPPVLAAISTANVLGASPTGFSPQSSSLTSTIDSVKYFAKAFFYFIVILGILFFGSKYFLVKNPSMLGSEKFRIIQKLPLEIQVVLYIVQAGEKYFLLGVGGKQITLLKEMTEKDLEAFWSGQPTKPLFEPFKEQLLKFLKNKKS